ncbi:MAG: 4Fe-4S binding protein [Candidatus Thorarchaeota archaeon]|nr:MAG: 4Fe-4S binding protein [Candidatus Thorarchaeota archaeon]
MKLPEIDAELCVGCAQCFLVCPEDAMDVLVEAKPNERCTGCGRCETACPALAIKMIETGFIVSE